MMEDKNSYNLGMSLKILEDVREKILLLKEEMQLLNKKVYLFGFNTIAYFVFDCLTEIGVSVEGIVDNSKNYIGCVYKDCPVSLPDNVLLPYTENVCVLIGSAFYPEMCKQLENMGYREGKHIIQIVNMQEMLETMKRKDLVPISDLDHKTIIMQLLKTLHKICEENGLCYYLGYGTLLGAVRHKGFIPWDDDIDVLMPMKDILALEQIVSDSKELSLLSPFNTKGYFRQFYKLMDNKSIGFGIKFPLKISLGVNIDIWPLVGIPEEEEKFGNEVRRLQQELNASFYVKGITMEEMRKNQLQIMNYLTQYSTEQMKKNGVITTRYFTKDVMDKKIFSNRIPMQFESEYFYVPCGYKEYLEQVYGEDYMQLPPEDKRTQVHYMEFYWK